jgi:hypothetical protein
VESASQKFIKTLSLSISLYLSFFLSIPPQTLRVNNEKTSADSSKAIKSLLTQLRDEFMGSTKSTGEKLDSFHSEQHEYFGQQNKSLSDFFFLYEEDQVIKKSTLRSGGQSSSQLILSSLSLSFFLLSMSEGRERKKERNENEDAGNDSAGDRGLGRRERQVDKRNLQD